jgi:hypothetical protein
MKKAQTKVNLLNLTNKDEVHPVNAINALKSFSQNSYPFDQLPQLEYKQVITMDLTQKGKPQTLFENGEHINNSEKVPTSKVSIYL